MMKESTTILLSLPLTILISCGGQETQNNTSGEESASTLPSTVAEFTDITDASHWHDFNGKQMSWIMEDSVLTTMGGKGDIVSNEVYGDFNLQYDWIISEGGNSGVLYMVKEGDYERTYNTGPEYQLIDEEGYNAAHDTPLENWQVTGANYALDTPSSIPTNPVGEWNHSEIIKKDGHVEHWLNGEKVVAYDLWTDEWKAKVKETKFGEHPDYGMAKEGRISLQDHGDRVWFKNVKIQSL